MCCAFGNGLFALTVAREHNVVLAGDVETPPAIWSGGRFAYAAHFEFELPYIAPPPGPPPSLPPQPPPRPPPSPPPPPELGAGLEAVLDAEPSEFNATAFAHALATLLGLPSDPERVVVRAVVPASTLVSAFVRAAGGGGAEAARLALEINRLTAQQLQAAIGVGVSAVGLDAASRGLLLPQSAPAGDGGDGGDGGGGGGDSGGGDSGGGDSSKGTPVAAPSATPPAATRTLVLLVAVLVPVCACFVACACAGWQHRTWRAREAARALEVAEPKRRRLDALARGERAARDTPAQQPLRAPSAPSASAPLRSRSSSGGTASSSAQIEQSLARTAAAYAQGVGARAPCTSPRLVKLGSSGGVAVCYSTSGVSGGGASRYAFNYVDGEEDDDDPYLTFL
ncbi:hypothetical protein KFE25_002570 [Diacronema lutheri]|uniref:Uncharacterized protein n=1 Tax=Diacronema lutheri TaxID=2081491 RepID=A0A8J6CF47_DIALT|nr:hypothetical protein KFE25_002570 [Diacronema lutheri]